MHPSLAISSEGQYGVMVSCPWPSTETTVVPASTYPRPWLLVAGDHFTLHSHGLHHRKEVHLTSHPWFDECQRMNVTVCEQIIDIRLGTDSRQELTTKIVSPRSPVYQEVIGGASLSLIILELATQSPLRSRCVRKPVEPNYTCASSRGKAAVTCHVSRDPCHNVTRENCGAESPCYSVTMSRRWLATRLLARYLITIHNQEIFYVSQKNCLYYQPRSNLLSTVHAKIFYLLS